jgi:hypothetical protein
VLGRANGACETAPGGGKGKRVNLAHRGPHAVHLNSLDRDDRRACSQGQAIVRARDEGRGGPSGDDTRNNVSVHIERSRENVFTVTATSQELSALVAAARMALEAMRSAPEPPPPSAVEILERVLREFDLARERLTADRP